MVGLTDNDPAVKAPVYKQYMYAQHNGTLVPQDTANITFPAAIETFRYVIVQNQFSHNETLCVADVQVYARGM